MKSQLSLKTLIAILVFTCSSKLIHAQPGNPGPDPDQPNASVPFDGGLSLLVAAGAGFAIKKARDKRKKENLRRDNTA